MSPSHNAAGSYLGLKAQMMKFWIKDLLLIVLNICAVKGFTEINVSCVYNSICILPCSFRYETDVLHWDYITWTGHDHVHSYYENKDQFEDQDPRFNGRTSLVEDQVTGRKTSLMLKNVKVQDEGTYRCFISNDDYGDQSSYVFLQVDAPVQRVDMVRAGNSITCSSEGVYPKPELTWSSSPQSSSTVQQTEEKLYNISSSLKLSDMDGDLLSCTVSTRLNKWTTTTTWRNPIVTTTSRAQICCSHTNTSFMDFNLLWRFKHTHVIMRWNRIDGQHVSAQWKKYVEAEKVSDVLHLQDLSSDQEGTYSCELSRAKETIATHTLLMVDTGTKLDVVLISLIGVNAAMMILVFILYHWKRRKEKLRNKKNQQETKDSLDKTELSHLQPKVSGLVQSPENTNSFLHLHNVLLMEEASDSPAAPHSDSHSVSSSAQRDSRETCPSQLLMEEPPPLTPLISHLLVSPSLSDLHVEETL